MRDTKSQSGSPQILRLTRRVRSHIQAEHPGCRRTLLNVLLKRKLQNSKYMPNLLRANWSSQSL